MGTRALIGYLDTSAKPMVLTSTYNHHDGYPSNLGKGLRNFYNDDERAEEIANVGYISYLDPATGEWDAKNEEPARVIRLDNDFTEAMIQIASEIDYRGAKYGYIWCPSDDRWHTIENREGIAEMISQLEEEFEHLNQSEVDEAYHIGDDKELIKKEMKNKEEMKEGLSSTNDQVGYLATALYDVWNKGTRKQPVNFEDLAQTLVKDMFDDYNVEPDRTYVKEKKDEIDEQFINSMKYKAGIIK